MVKIVQRFHSKPATGKLSCLLPKLSPPTLMINYTILTVSLRSILIYSNSTKQPEYQVNFFLYVQLLLGCWIL